MKWLLTAYCVFITFSQILAQTDNRASMRDWHYPYEVHHVSVSDSVDVAYVDEGSGEHVLLFIHGLGSNLKAWQKNIDFLKTEYRCIALDLPGYGRSGKEVYPFSMTFFAETLRGFIDAKDLNNVVLVGHSMGGQIAMHTVLKDDGRIAKLVLIAPAGFETFTAQEKAWFENSYTSAVVKATPEHQIVTNFHSNFHVFPDDAQFMIDDRLLMRQTEEYTQYCQMIPQCVMGMLNEPVFDNLPEIRLPTLILYGENDVLIPNKFFHPDLTTLAVAKDGQARIPNSEMRMIPMAGHFVQWEQAGPVNEIIWEFLK